MIQDTIHKTLLQFTDITQTWLDGAEKQTANLIQNAEYEDTLEGFKSMLPLQKYLEKAQRFS